MRRVEPIYRPCSGGCGKTVATVVLPGMERIAEKYNMLVGVCSACVVKVEGYEELQHQMQLDMAGVIMGKDKRHGK